MRDRTFDEYCLPNTRSDGDGTLFRCIGASGQDSESEKLPSDPRADIGLGNFNGIGCGITNAES
jgi:hypothetical protein